MNFQVFITGLSKTPLPVAIGVIGLLLLSLDNNNIAGWVGIIFAIVLYSNKSK